MSSRPEKRRDKRDLLDVPLIHGHPVVVAVTVQGARDEGTGERMYGALVCAPQTDHTNGEIIALLAMLACTPVFGEAQASGGKVSLQQAIDGCVGIFKTALEGHVHRMVASGSSVKNLKTVQIERMKPESTT